MPYSRSLFSKAQTGVFRPAYSGSGPSWKLIAATRASARTSAGRTFRLVTLKT